MEGLKNNIYWPIWPFLPLIALFLWSN